MSHDPRRTHYRVLMVAESADTDIINTVFRRLAQRYHPDVDPTPDAARRMRDINEAHAVLRDPERRARYDADLASRRDRRAGDRILHRTGEVPYGEAGMPAGPAQGTILDFGRYGGWSLGQIKRSDPDYLEWLMRAPVGRQYRDEISQLLGRRA